MLWNSHSLVDYCSDNLFFKVHFKLATDELSQCIEEEMEPWCARNHIILRKSKEKSDFTCHFNLINAHKITGELLVAPVIFFINNPDFKLHCEQPAILNELVKMNSLSIKVKENQVVCFDKQHYQFSYADDLNFVRVSHAS